MQIKGKVVCVYPEVSGTYLGTSYRNQCVIIVSDDYIPGTKIHDRYVVKFKNDNIDLASSSGCLSGTDSYVFTLLADVIERRRNDGTMFPVPKPLVCLALDKA